MKNIKYTLLLFLGLGVIGTSCDSEDDLIEERIAETTPIPPTFTEGDADFTNFVSLGNSLTAGFMDGALYDEGQMNSFPNIMGQQMIAAGLTADFNQPDINSVNGFNSTFSNVGAGVIAGKTILDTSIPGPVPTFPGELLTAFSGDKSSLNNFGVPGARTTDLLTPGYGFPDVGNPYFTRFASDPSSASILADALATNPTFFSLWIGSNDVLGYALSGGVGNDPLVDYSAAAFQGDYGNMIGQLLGAGSQGIVINVPPVLLIPFLRAVPWNAIPLDAATAAATNAAFNDPATGYNPGLGAALALGIIDQAEYDLRLVNWAEGQNGFLIDDPELTTADISAAFGFPAGSVILPNYRQTKATDLVPLSAGAVLGTLADPNDPTSVNGVGVALGDQFALTAAEQTAVVTARATYSGIIQGIAAATSGVEMFDIQPLFADIAGLTPALATQLALTPAAIEAADGVQGLEYEGVTIAPDFSPSGIFSTDGVHPNPRGHAILANELIHFINSSFGSNIPTVNSTVYRTVLFQ